MSNCPVCSSEAFKFKKIITSNNAYFIYKCSNCRLEFTNPMPTNEVLDEFYASYDDVRASIDVVNKNALRNINFLARLGLESSSRVLDFGSGKNAFVSLGGDGWYSYDPHTSNCDRTVLKRESYDAVTAWGVLEHVVDPVQFTSQLCELLKREGLLILTTVDIDGNIPYRFKPPEHLTYWSQDAMGYLMERAGLRLVSYSPYFMVQHRQIYMDIMLRTMPAELKHTVNYKEMPEFVEIPTNETIVVARKL